ncbi:MAG: hypothetical protein ACK5AZ_06575 [Bryobacteraceae bacterium]
MLVVSPYEDDFLAVKPVFGPAGRLERCLTFAEARQSLHSNGAAILVVERDLPDGCWQDLLDEISHLQNPPVLIVTSRFADEHLWAEVLNLGGYDVLQKPLEKNEVSRVLTMAWRQWRGRMEPAPELIASTATAAQCGSV